MNSFVHEKRKAMTPQRVLRIFQASGGKCHKCGRKLGPADDYDIDHIIALENGGTDDDANLAPCCDWCHTTKTADDHELAGHGRRMAAKQFVPKKFKQSKWRK
jgi:5-methylcytosine-specific restriction endonuclease McrA